MRNGAHVLRAWLLQGTEEQNETSKRIVAYEVEMPESRVGIFFNSTTFATLFVAFAASLVSRSV